MIIRSVAASPFTGILLPDKGNARLDALVIKASAGTLFKARIIHCGKLPTALTQLKNTGATVASLAPNGSGQLSDITELQRAVFVLGNESQGVSSQVGAVADLEVSIPMANGVESLNVAVTAALIAFNGMFNK
jgi:23S rRNA (guanosine2251-2'-O)-methyltransferase